MTFDLESRSDKEKLLSIINDLPSFARNFLKIRKKSGDISDFSFNRAQLYAHAIIEEQLKQTGKVRILALKGRQQGFSTYTQSRLFHKVVTNPGKRAFILTHQAEATKYLFDMTKRFYDLAPEGLFPQLTRSSAKEMGFSSIGSTYGVGTAGSAGIGRGQTIQLFHGSEIAFWESADEHAKGILQGVPGESGTEIILESTANGIGNYFYDIWVAAVTGKSEFKAIFLPWYWQDEYKIIDKPDLQLSDEELDLLSAHAKDGMSYQHLLWRRLKIQEFSTDYETGAERFKQEYPNTWAEAFRNPIQNLFIRAAIVQKARNNEVETESPLVIGVDPAVSDNDRLAIIRRRGRRAYNLDTYHNLNTMEIVGLLREIIKKERPQKVCIDCIGIGAGIVDRLKELGYSEVEGVNVAHAPADRERFRNKRAELWHELRDWLTQEMGVEIPDSDELQGDLTAPGYKFDSSHRLLIESKDDMRKRGMKSPDCAEALMLTFAVGEYLHASSYSPVIMPPRSHGMLT